MVQKDKLRGLEMYDVGEQTRTRIKKEKATIILVQKGGSRGVEKVNDTGA